MEESFMVGVQENDLWEQFESLENFSRTGTTVSICTRVTTSNIAVQKARPLLKEITCCHRKPLSIDGGILELTTMPSPVSFGICGVSVDNQ